MYNDNTEEKINFVKGQTSGQGPILIQSNLGGIDINANWTAEGSGRKGFAAKLTRAKGQDLDLVAIASQGTGPKLLCWYGDVDPFDNGALFSEGDDRKGRGGETIKTTWTGLDTTIDRITYILAAFKPNVSFANVSKVVATVTGADGVEIGKFRPDIDAGQNALILGQARKTPAGWAYSEANAMTVIPRNNQLDPGPEFKAGILRVARAWATQEAA